MPPDDEESTARLSPGPKLTQVPDRTSSRDSWEEFAETTLGEHGRRGRAPIVTEPAADPIVTAGDAGPVTAEGPPDPLRELVRFHGHIRRALRGLQMLASGEDSDGSVHANAAGLIDFLSGPLVWHDIDEETSLLPRLRRAKHSHHLDEMIAAVQRQHEAMEGLIEQTLPHLEAAARDRTRDLDGFSQVTRVLVDVLEQHLALEEQELFPYARLALSDEDLAEIDQEIRQRTVTRTRGMSPVLELP